MSGDHLVSVSLSFSVSKVLTGWTKTVEKTHRRIGTTIDEYQGLFVIVRRDLEIRFPVGTSLKMILSFEEE